MTARPMPGDPTAIVEPGAEIGEDVEIGAYAIVEARVRIGRATRLHAHAVVRGPTTLGKGNVVHPFAVLGGEPQAKRHHGGPSPTRIGDHNVVREHVTVHGGTEGRTTTIGSHNLLMVSAHVAHDVTIGAHCIVANAVQLAGHSTIGDWVTFGGLAGLAQFVRVGDSAFVAAGAMCERDVPPFVIVQGDRARVRGLNIVGLRRRGIAEESIAALASAYRALFASKDPRAAALARVRLATSDPLVGMLIAALEMRSKLERVDAPDAADAYDEPI